VDSGVAGRMLGVGEAQLASAQPQAMTQLGHLLETFCVGEVLKQVSWVDGSVRAGHWRTHDGDEVDLILERRDGRVVAIEIKAGEAVSSASFRGLCKLRDALGERFVAGAVLHLGHHSRAHDDRIYALPVDRLWASA